jgi:hypothetical protein
VIVDMVAFAAIANCCCNVMFKVSSPLLLIRSPVACIVIIVFFY